MGLRIARVVHLFRPEGIGDPFSTYELSRRQANQGDSVRVHTWSRSGTPSIETVSDRFVVVRYRGPNLRIPFLFDEYPLLPPLGGDIRQGQFGIVHAHSHLFLTSLQAALSSHDARIPFVVTVHGVTASRGFPTSTAQRAYLYTLGRRVFDLATRVVCVTESDAREIMTIGCRGSKIKIIPNAVDSDVFMPGRAGRRGDEVLWVGRFVPEKGVEILLAAAKLVLQRRSVTFRLVGDGPLRNRMERIAEGLDIREHVIFQGQVIRDEVARIMSQASVFVLPSVKEGLPKVLLEAMASGIPVAASNIPAVREVITDRRDGVLFRQGDARALADAILGLLEDRGMARRLGDEARFSMVERYSWGMMLERLNKVYQGAIDTG